MWVVLITMSTKAIHIREKTALYLKAPHNHLKQNNMFTNNINSLTPIFREAIEEFIPEWLESLLPYYQETKQNGDDILELSNVISSEGEHYEKNGIYTLHHTAAVRLWQTG